MFVFFRLQSPRYPYLPEAERDDFKEEIMSYIIMTDTSANIPTAEAAAKGIVVVPLSYNVGGEERFCLDTADFDYTAYYESMKNGERITTSQINPQRYVEYMEPILKEGKDILFVGMSSGISGSFHSASIAKDQLLEDYPDRSIALVDSHGASLGEGLLVLQAEAWQAEGKNLEENATDLTALKERMYQVFTVDDLMHLRRGGRLSNASAIVGTLLNVKPVLKGNELGKIVSFGKVRGRRKVIERLAELYDKLVVDASSQVIGISHANCMEDVKTLIELIRAKQAPRDILVVDHEPVTGSYLGPGALALYFLGGEDVRTR